MRLRKPNELIGRGIRSLCTMNIHHFIEMQQTGSGFSQVFCLAEESNEL